MPEQTLVVSRLIHAPVEQVWDVLSDLSSMSRRLSAVQSVQIMTSGPYAVGTRWRETRTTFRRVATEEKWVRRNDPLRSTVIEAGEGQRRCTTTWKLVPGEGTDLTVTFTGTSPDGGIRAALSRVAGPMSVRATRKAIERDFDDIEAAAFASRSA